MRVAVLVEPGVVELASVPTPCLKKTSDAIIRVTASGICGTDLWYYRGLVAAEPGMRMGHEFVGVVEEVGNQVTGLVPGDFVIAPFAFSCGTCDMCTIGLQTSCYRGGFWADRPGIDGGQGELVRVPFADSTLVKAPMGWLKDTAALGVALSLCDVLPTGEHAAVLGQVGESTRVLILGDGPIAIAAVAACARRHPRQVTVVGHHEDRLARAMAAGASVVLLASDISGIVSRVKKGQMERADVVIECVGNRDLIAASLELLRPKGSLVYVGIPVVGTVEIDLHQMFRDNITLVGGITPVRSYLPTLLDLIVSGHWQVPELMTDIRTIDEIKLSYELMNQRRTLKAMLLVS